MTYTTKTNGNFENICSFSAHDDVTWGNAILALSYQSIEFTAYDPGQFPGFEYASGAGLETLHGKDSDQHNRYIHYSVSSEQENLAYGNALFYIPEENNEIMDTVVNQVVELDLVAA